MGDHVQYIGIQLGALVLYLFLLCCFLNPVKERVVRQFRTILLTSIMWVGGSLFMRMQFLPGLTFWYHVSLMGISFLFSAYYNIITSLIDRYSKRKAMVVFGMALGLNLLNIVTGILLAPPEAIESSHGIQYTYHVDEGMLLFFIPLALIMGDIVWSIYQAWKEDRQVFQRLRLLEVGLLLIFVGNLVMLVPGNTFPVDVLSGLIAAIMLAAMLYQRQLFEISEQMITGVVYSFGILMAASPLFFFDTILEVVPGEYIEPSAYDSVILCVLPLGVWMAIVLISASLLLRRYNLYREAELEEKISSLQNRVNATFDVEEISRAVMTALADMTGSPGALIRTYEPGTGNVLTYSMGQLRNVPLYITQHSAILDYALAHGECYFNRRKNRGMLQADEALQEWTRQHQIGNIGCLIHDGELLGYVFLVENTHYTSTMTREKFIGVICNSAASSLRNAFLYQKVYRDAIMDDLTGLNNRRYVQQQIAWMEKKHISFGVLHLDLDEFRLYNEIYGMAEGDKLLQWCADILRQLIPEDAVVSRYGSNEFVVFFPEVNTERMYAVGKKILEALADETGRSEKHVHYVTMSGGISAYPLLASTASEALHQAETATQQSKSHGMNQIHVYNQTDIDENHSAYEEVAPTIYALTAAIDAKDSYTFVHVQNVARYAVELAKALGYNSENIEIIRQAALLHDIGKISIPEYILKKKGKLTDEEYKIMKKHVVNSIDIIQFLPGMNYVIPAVIGHHERYDGKGYPRGIAGSEIPEFARILAIADSFDAITAKRSYKESNPVSYAIEELIRCKGAQFDPQMTDVFVALLEDGTITLEEEGRAAG